MFKILSLLKHLLALNFLFCFFCFHIYTFYSITIIFVFIHEYILMVFFFLTILIKFTYNCLVDIKKKKKKLFQNVFKIIFLNKKENIIKLKDLHIHWKNINYFLFIS